MKRISVLFFFFLVFVPNLQAKEIQPRHVVLISFDGLRPDAISLLGSSKAPHFYRLMQEGASTLNARTDTDYTITLPNHTCMITGVPVLGPGGHHVIENGASDQSVHDYAGHYVKSVFDVLRQHKRKSAMLASKLKFSLFSRSYPIDTVRITDYDDSQTLKNFQELLSQGLPDFVFMHFSGPDRVGHKHGWDVRPGSAYMDVLWQMDGYLGQIISRIEASTSLKDSTVVIITSDHGGQGLGHGDPKNPKDYTIPFIIWGKAVAKGVDLYTINTGRRKNPLSHLIDYQDSQQPVRNGDAANLVLSVLRLPVIEGSYIGHSKPLCFKEFTKE